MLLFAPPHTYTPLVGTGFDNHAPSCGIKWFVCEVQVLIGLDFVFCDEICAIFVPSLVQTILAF